LLNTRAVAILPVELAKAPALFLTVHAVHAGQHFGPVLAFGTAGAAVDLQYGRQLVFRLVERAFKLGFIEQLQGLAMRLFGLLLGGIAGLPEVEKHGKILHRGGCLLVQLYPVLVELDVFENFSSPLIVVPKAGREGQLLVFVYLILSVPDVKETSSGQPGGPS